MVDHEEMAKTDSSLKEARKIARPGGEDADEHGITPEMQEMAEALAHPDGDPYLNARNMGFYCEQCG